MGVVSCIGDNELMNPQPLITMKVKRTKKAGGVVVELESRETQLPTGPAHPEFKLRKILVPVDFSACSYKALQYALPFAREFNASIVLLHVVEPFIPVPEMTAVNFEVIRKQTMSAAQSEMKKLRESIPADVAAEAVISEGNPYYEIGLATRKLGIDLIIIATHGRTGLAHVFMGSTAERVVRHAECPVLTVREHEHDFVTNQVAA